MFGMLGKARSLWKGKGQSTRAKTPIILHYHIYKNAGSTIDGILAKNFQGRCGHIESSAPSGTVSAESLVTYCQTNPEISVVSSHQARPPAPEVEGLEFLPLFFIRHPIDRVGSVYSFARRQSISNRGAEFARAHSFPEFVRWRLSDQSGAVIKNFQTIFLSGQHTDMRTAVASDIDFKRAGSLLRNSSFFGLVESFDLSLKLLDAYLSKHFGPLDLTPNFENKSHDRSDSLEHRLQSIQESLGDTLYEELVAKNHYDIMLYELAVAIFNSRAQQLTDRAFSEKASPFRRSD